MLIVSSAAAFAEEGDIEAVSAGSTATFSFPLGHPVYGELRDLLRAAGRPLFSWSPPFDAREIRSFLDSLDPVALDDELFALYESVERHVGSAGARGQADGGTSGARGPAGGGTSGARGPAGGAVFSEGAFSFDLGPSLSLELRGRSDSSVSWLGRAKDETPLVALPMDFSWGGRVHGALDIDVRNCPAAWMTAPGPLDSNVPWPVTDVDLSVPYRAFIAASGPWWTFKLGRDLVDHGAGRSGNLAVSANPDYYDQLRLSLFSKSLRYTLFVAQLPLELVNDGMTPLPFGGGRTPDEFPLDTVNNATGVLDTGRLETVNRHLYYSRIDFSIRKRLGLSLGQGNLVANAPLELRFLNPFIIYHSQWSWRDYSDDYETASLVGSLFTVDLDLALPAGLAFYGQFSMNEFTTGTEKNLYGNTTTPGSVALLGGLEWVRVFSGGRLSLAFEGLWGSSYLYLLTSPWASFIWMNRHSALYNTDRQAQWLGHPNARDSIFFCLDGRFEEAARSWKARASWQLKGEHADLVYDYAKSEENAALVAPSGIIEHCLSLTAGLDWRFAPSFSAGGTVAFYHVINSAHVVGDFSSGVQGSLSVSWMPRLIRRAGGRPGQPASP